MNELQALEEAIRRAGGQAALGRAVGAAQQTVGYWLHTLKRASPEYALKIERATGVSRHDLAPEMYPREHAA